MQLTTRNGRWLFLCLLTVAAPAITVETVRTYSSKREFLFSFQYPASWSLSPTQAANSRVKVAAPAGTPEAACTVTAQRSPRSAGVSQEEIDQHLVALLSPSSFRNGFVSQGFENVEIVAVSVGELGSHPAQMVQARYSIGTRSGPAFGWSRMAVTATPGVTWSVSCASQGATPAAAEKGFQHWRTETNRVMSSFTFN